MANVSIDTLVQIKQGRGEKLNTRQIRGLARKGQVTIGILTDTQTVAALRATPSDAVHTLATKGSAAVLINEHAIQLKGTILTQGAAAGTMLTLPVSRFMPLYEKQLLRAGTAPALFKSWMSELAKSATSNNVVGQARAVGMSMEGRLAMGSMIVQGVGAYYGIMAYMSTTDSDKSTGALLTIADGIAGVLGGAAEMGAKWVEVRLGAELALKSVGLAYIRAGATAMGIAGGIVNAWMCFRAAAVLKKDGHQQLASRMNWAGGTFIFAGAPIALILAHQLTLIAIRRGAVSGVVMLAEQQLGKLVAARLGTAAIGLTVPGIGWALTIVAVGQTVYVVVNTPTAVETWLKNCYFGKPESESERRKTWPEEDSAWKALQGPAEESKPASVPATTPA